MLVIRRQQVEAMAAAATTSFTQRTVKHLRELFPEDCASESEEALAARVHRGIERAAHYEITEEDAVFLFVVVTFVLGPDFDRDPRHAWATEILANREADPSDRMATICDECADRLDAESGAP